MQFTRFEVHQLWLWANSQLSMYAYHFRYFPFSWLRLVPYTCVGSPLGSPFSSFVPFLSVWSRERLLGWPLPCSNPKFRKRTMQTTLSMMHPVGLRNPPCLALPCLALPCLALPCLASPRLALPRLALPCLAILDSPFTPISSQWYSPNFTTLVWHHGSIGIHDCRKSHIFSRYIELCYWRWWLPELT